MKTILIVEDEKMIRRGIKAMVQRSGVPVDTILECNNGETALEILKQQEIDVMFTDIRMPKMDGIELVNRMQECDHVPLTVAISGFDDFSYAVEMLRNGVREYLLKPVERDRINMVLHKLNDELESKKERDLESQRISYQQIRHLILNEEVTEEEWSLVERQYLSWFEGKTYRVCCWNTEGAEIPDQDSYIFLNQMGDGDLFITDDVHRDQLLEAEYGGGYRGVSAGFQRMRDLKIAVAQAFAMRKEAFCRNRNVRIQDAQRELVSEQLIRKAARLLQAEENEKRIQMLGNDYWEELEKNMGQFFFEVRNGRISPDQFQLCMRELLDGIEKNYVEVVEESREEFDNLKKIWMESCLDLYSRKVLEYFQYIQQTNHFRNDQSLNRRKIKEALAYIDENYASDLNMAVVSNYISMNYSLFSYSFKQYTGTNFVNYIKDIRMREAKKLLTESDLKIIEISQEVGYPNEKHFMKTFKAHFGVSPTEYRRNMQKT